MAAAVTIEAGRVEEKLVELAGRSGPYFSRVEPLRQVGKYVRWLMSDLPRKNCRTLAGHAGDRTPNDLVRDNDRGTGET